MLTLIGPCADMTANVNTAVVDSLWPMPRRVPFDIALLVHIEILNGLQTLTKWHKAKSVWLIKSFWQQHNSLIGKILIAGQNSLIDVWTMCVGDKYTSIDPSQSTTTGTGREPVTGVQYTRTQLAAQSRVTGLCENCQLFAYLPRGIAATWKLYLGVRYDIVWIPTQTGYLLGAIVGL